MEEQMEKNFSRVWRGLKTISGYKKHNYQPEHNCRTGSRWMFWIFSPCPILPATTPSSTAPVYCPTSTKTAAQLSEQLRASGSEDLGDDGSCPSLCPSIVASYTSKWMKTSRQSVETSGETKFRPQHQPKYVASDQITTGYKSRSSPILCKPTLPDDFSTLYAHFHLLNKESAVKSMLPPEHKSLYFP